MTNQDKNWILFCVIVFVASGAILYLTGQI